MDGMIIYGGGSGPESQEELEARLGSGGPSWDSLVLDFVGAPIVAIMSVAVALEQAGIPRLRQRAWLNAYPERASELADVEGIRKQRRKEAIDAAMMAVVADPDAPVAAKMRAMENAGKDVGLYKEENGLAQLAETLGAVLGRSMRMGRSEVGESEVRESAVEDRSGEGEDGQAGGERPRVVNGGLP